SLLLACQVAPAMVSGPGVDALATVSASVWKRYLKSDYDRVFMEHDRNHNSLIEAEEIPHAPQAFASLDRDHSGALSRQEALPDTKHLQYLTDYMVRNLKPSNHGAGTDDPQLSLLPGPAELDHFGDEITSPIQSMAANRRKTPVLLVPGYAEPSWYFMSGLYKDLKNAGWAVEGINLFPNFASAEEQAAKIKTRVEEIKRRLKVSQVNLVVHSFGGLICRYYIQELGGAANVKNLITVATPHLGTYTAYLGPGDSAVQLRPKSAFLQKLNRNGFAYPPVKYTSIWSNLDEIVIPPKNSIMPESSVRYVPWTGHLTIMFSQRTYRYVREALAE
ncbi:MAG TPA: alpha/beta fold hydrolase, partial [Candidatus Obscuribacterales bacterium]